MVSPKVISNTPRVISNTPRVTKITFGILFLNDNSLNPFFVDFHIFVNKNQGLQFYPNILTFLLQTLMYRAIGHVRENRFRVTSP